MADLSDSTLLPRRALIAGAAALMAAPAIATAATRKISDPTFTEKLKAFREAQAALEAAEEDATQRVEALGPCPSFPRELCEAFINPDNPHAAKPGPEGWSAEALQQIIGGRYWDRKAGWMYFLPSGSPIRVRAGELLAVRLAYDSAWNAYDDAATAIYDSTQPLSKEADRRALDLMSHPASSLAQVREKISIAQELYLFDHSEGEDVREAIMRDVLTIADA